MLDACMRWNGEGMHVEDAYPLKSETGVVQGDSMSIPLELLMDEALLHRERLRDSRPSPYNDCKTNVHCFLYNSI
jgi:hypothetical protein